MKTLVERLRHGPGDVVRDTELMNEAADEICALRKALFDALDGLGAMCNPSELVQRNVCVSDAQAVAMVTLADRHREG